MNKAEMAGRLAARTGLSKSVAREAVDGVFAAVGDALANGEEARIAGFETFGKKQAGPYRTQDDGSARDLVLRRGAAEVRRRQGRRAMDQPQAQDREPALPLRMRGFDRAVPSSQSMARTL